VLFGWLAVSAWLRPLALPDEGRYVGVAFEMQRSGNWLVPTLDTLPYFHKPPLFYWLTAASLAIFGSNEFAVRLPSLLAATGSALALYLFIRRWIGASHARMTLMILATTPFFFACAQFANLDMLVSGCICSTVLAAADAVLAAEDGRPRRLTLVAAYAFAALGVVAKGLIGVAIPAIVIGGWLLYLRRPAMILSLLSAEGTALFAILVIPWFVLIEQRYPAFFHYFFVHHHLERYTSGDFNSHQPFWFYLPVLAGFTLPWFVLLPRAVRPNANEGDASRHVHALMWIWLLATVVFFSIPKSKLLGYVLVAVPPMAVLCARGLAQFADTPPLMRRWTIRFVALAAAICVATLVGGLVYERNNVRGLLAQIPVPIAATDEIITLHSYPFSLAFYLRLRQPVRVVEDWDQRLLLRKDSWRKELWEAAQFAGAARARAILLKPGEFGRHIACARNALWIIAEEQVAAAYPEMARLERVGNLGGYAVWHSPPPRAQAEASGC
jgi:4-amino-4-deoxy-L-arabinose transferase-like glycosyltransferase